MPIHYLMVSPRSTRDPRAANLLADAQALGFTSLNEVQVHDLYFVEGDLDDTRKHRLTAELFGDPLTQVCQWHDAPRDSDTFQVIETALRPGVTDTVAEQIKRAARELGITGIVQVATGQHFVIHSAPPLTPPDLDLLARRLLANPVIHRYALGTIDAVFPHAVAASSLVEVLPVRELADDELLALSRKRLAALDLDEMRAVQGYFNHLEGDRIPRDPSDIEFETIAQTWSEHCSHKTFKARLEIRDWGLGVASPISELQSPIPTLHSPISNLQIDGLLKTFIRSATEEIAAPWVRSAFVDNAGIIDFDDEFEVSFKVETHNHPSAIEPFGGANTGTGGVIRDVLGVSAKPIAATDVLCFGPPDLDFAALPEGVLHPRRIRSGVIAGVQDYGNKIGIPTVNGAIWYDPGYTANPLVFCGCVGIAPKGGHVSQPHPGDRVIVLGGRTGRDGLRGATFSSMTMDAQTGQVSGASVQIGDPITEKGLIEVIVRARDRRMYHAITDCGAGGLSSAVGELASRAGVDVDLARVRLKYAGLVPWEIWLSEAQERMVLAVPAESVPPLQALCDTFDVEFTDIGEFTDTDRLIVRYEGKVVLDLENDFLFRAMPQRTLTAQVTYNPPAARPPSPVTDFGRLLLELLAHPNIASKAATIRIYDHEVQGGTVVKPLTGAMDDGPSDACVLKPLHTSGSRGIVLSNGINPEFGKRDPYRMAVSVVDEAIRNAVAVGADPERIALLDNFCWGDPLRPETLGGLVQAARGCREAALHYRTPFISGKDSLNNEYLGSDGRRHAIPPTLLISAIGIIDDVTRAVTMDWKEANGVIYLLGETRAEFGGSHFELINHASPTSSEGTLEQSRVGETAPDLRGLRDLEGLDNPQAQFEPTPATQAYQVPGMPSHVPARYRALHRAMQANLVRACHDLSEGGLAVALAEMCIGGRLGCQIELDTDDLVSALFSESNGRLLVEVRPEDCAAFEAYLAPHFNRIGAVTEEATISVTNRSQIIFSLPVATLVTAWNRNP